MKNKTCFFFVLLIFVLSVSRDNAQSNENFIEGIKRGTLRDANIDSVKIASITNEILKGEYNIHCLLILRNNKLVVEKYFKGKDEQFAVPLGEREHTRDSLHDCRSLTKSVVSACIGIAIGQHKIQSVNDRIFLYLPEYEKYDTGTKHDITIKDLLTMSAGFEWNENIPYSNPANSELQALGQKDVIDFVLKQPLKSKPGTSWNYSGGCTLLLAEILRKATGENIESFANKNIFKPLGIKNFIWYKKNDGMPWSPSGLRLRPIDIAKFGSLYLNGGNWNNTAIIPSEWIKHSISWQINSRNESQGYGYQFWCTKKNIGNKEVEIAMAIGYGGQRIYLIPDFDLEVVMTAGNYNEQSDLPDKIFFNQILPAIGE